MKTQVALFTQENSLTVSPRRKRGVALLLVMIGLVVCSLLTAGFLSSQGTAIGIARNERDAEKARALSQSGIEMCYWLIKNRTDWRTALSPGTWINAAAVGDGTVTVTAASGDGTATFYNDTTQPVILTSTGTINGRSFTLTASIGPTGGGTVFRGGNFCKGRIIMGTNDLIGSSVIDSYDSSVSAYNSLFPGSNAVFGTNMSGDWGLVCFFLSTYKGSFIGGSKQNLSTTAYSTFNGLGPSSTTLNTQPFTIGKVTPPNTAGLTARGAYSRTSSASLTLPGKYDSFTLNPNGIIATTVTITTSGIYYISGNLTINSLAHLTVATGVNATIVVDGSATLAGTIRCSGTGTCTLYVGGPVTLNGSGSMNFFGQNTSNFTLFTTGSDDVTLNSTSQIWGAVYAPRSSVSMQSSSRMYGAIMCKDLTMQGTSAFHFDENLKNKRIDNITEGSAPAGTANYSVTITGSVSLGS
jgi:Tfp pilus assembly protein PilX